MSTFSLLVFPPLNQVPSLTPPQTYTQLTFGDWNDSHPAASPSAQKIAFVSQRVDGNHLNVMDPDGRHQFTIASFSSGALGPLEFSPDGHEIAFLLYSIENRSTSIMTTDIGPETTTRVGPAEVGIVETFHWSPDGRQIIFDLNQSGVWSIRLLDAETHQEEILLPVGGQAGGWEFRDPSWAPDGRSIVFASDSGGARHNIWEMNLSTTQVSRLTNGSGDSTRPSVSPDGRYVAYVSTNSDSGAASLWVVDRKGENAHVAFSYPLDQNPGIGWVPVVSSASYPAWNSISQGVIFYSDSSSLAKVFVYYANITVSVYRHVAPTVRMTGNSIVPMIFAETAKEAVWGASDQQIVYSTHDSSGNYHVWTRLLGSSTPKPSYGSR